MSARAIKNEILDFKKEFFEIKENLSFRLFLSLSLGSLFLMGCEEKLAQEPEQAEPVIVTSKEQAEAARDFAVEQGAANRDHEKEVKGMELDAEKDLAAQQADTARYEADSEIAQAVTEGNARVAQAQVAADGQANAAMMGGVFNVAGVGLQGFMQRQVEEAKAAANLRAVEAAQVAARMRAENERERTLIEAGLIREGRAMFDQRSLRIENYYCGGTGQRSDGDCGTADESWNSKMGNALNTLKTELDQAEEETDLAKKADLRNDAINKFVITARGLRATNITDAQGVNTQRAIRAFIERVRDGENPSSFNLQDIYRADMVKENEALSRSLGISSATRETGVDSTYHAAYRDAPRATETETFRE